GVGHLMGDPRPAPRGRPVEPALVRRGPEQAVTGASRIDQPRLGCHEISRVDAELLPGFCHEVGHEHVGSADELIEDLSTSRLRDVQADAALAAVGDLEVDLRQRPYRVATIWMFDLDDLSTPVGED